MLTELRPLGVGETLDAAVAVFRLRFWALIKLTALVVLPVQVLQSLILLSATPDSLTHTATGSITPTYDSAGAGDLWIALAASLSTMALGFVSTALATAANTKLVADTYLDEQAGAGESLRFAGRRFWTIIGAALATGILTAVGIFACFVPGILLAVAWSIVVPVLVVENARVGEALRRSFNLVKTRFWPMFGLLVTGTLLATILQLLVAAGLELAFSPLGDSVTGSIAANGIAEAAARVLTTPFVAAAFVIAYFDLRIRNEGFDVWVMIRHLDRAAMSPARP